MQGASVTLTATVTGATTGTVQFFSDNTLLGSATLANGIAALATTAIPIGTHTLRAEYSGDVDHFESSGSVAHTVLIATTTAIDTTADVIAFGVPITITAQVSASSGTPQGTVAFYDGNEIYQSVALTSGTASMTITFRDSPHTLKPYIQARRHTRAARPRH